MDTAPLPLHHFPKPELPSSGILNTEAPQTRLCHFNQKPTAYYPPARVPPKTPVPPLLIPPSAIPAIISSNKQSVIDRKLKRKAETHKTIPCRAWKDTGRCNYGTRCKFAHGDEDLRMIPEEPPKIFNSPKYRTELCVKYHLLGSCPYGERCSYIHEPKPQIDLEKCLSELSPPSSPLKNDQQYVEDKFSQSTFVTMQDMGEMDSMQNCSQQNSVEHLKDDTTDKNCSTAFRDPFTTGDDKENIELKLLPFMDSFLKRPFYVL